jgi:transposase
MKPIFIRPLTETEHKHIQAGLRSSSAFVLRRCQMLLASARGERATAIAEQLGCDDQTVRNVIKGFNHQGLAVPKCASCRPHRLRTTIPDEKLPALRELLHRSPREFGIERGVWSLDLAAQVAFSQGLTPVPTTGASVRRALARLGVSWKRAKHWIKSPDPMYRQKKRRVIASSPTLLPVRIGRLAFSIKSGGPDLLCPPCTPGKIGITRFV